MQGFYHIAVRGKKEDLAKAVAFEIFASQKDMVQNLQAGEEATIYVANGGNLSGFWEILDEIMAAAPALEGIFWGDADESDQYSKELYYSKPGETHGIDFCIVNDIIPLASPGSETESQIQEYMAEMEELGEKQQFASEAYTKPRPFMAEDGQEYDFTRLYETYYDDLTFDQELGFYIPQLCDHWQYPKEQEEARPFFTSLLYPQQ